MFSIFHKIFRVSFFVALTSVAAAFALFSVKADSPDIPRSRPYVGQLYVSLVPRNMRQVEAIWTSASVVLAPDDPAVVEHHVAINPLALSALKAAGIQKYISPFAFYIVL
jgi:hypothetical protein